MLHLQFAFDFDLNFVLLLLARRFRSAVKASVFLFIHTSVIVFFVDSLVLLRFHVLRIDRIIVDGKGRLTRVHVLRVYSLVILSSIDGV